MPERASRTRIHIGVTDPGGKPAHLAQHEPVAGGRVVDAGRADVTGHPPSAPSPACAGSPASAGSVNGTPNAIASSRATPRTDTQ